MDLHWIKKMPTLYMLIGVPGSGKSTWVANQNFDWNRTRIISTDNIIDRQAQAMGKTYSEVFDELIKGATQQMNQDLRQAITDGADIVWDQTNLVPKSRANKLAQIPKNYRKVAVYFTTPDTKELDRRLANRPGKTIPAHVITSMVSQLQPPTTAEGFDEVITV